MANAIERLKSPEKSNSSSSLVSEDTVIQSDKRVSQCRALSERVGTHLQRTRAALDVLSGEATTLQQSIMEQQRYYKDHKEKLEPSVWDNLVRAQHIFEGGGPGDDLRKLIPKKDQHALIIRLLLGNTVNIVSKSRAESLALKEDYYAFKDSNAWWFLVFSLVLYAGHRYVIHLEQAQAPITFVPPLKVGLLMFLCWLLYFYVAISLRENVLKANGSKLLSWWIYHHYYSILLVLLMLTLPVDSPAVNSYSGHYLAWCVGQGVVMVLQNRYQRRRMYTRIALGKDSNMDVVAGESSGTSGQLLFLIPFLFGLQLMQFLVGLQIVQHTWRSLLTPQGWLTMEEHASDLRGSRGACVCGLLFVRMAIGNFVATMHSLAKKREFRKHVRSKRDE
mmetsp:Transcript_21446/g.29805  ORF Transcript_21446/g.29805 Transcript_21446/m.29805 type:complete len:391 (+) Transcript_21446:90-1262(+)|eukprot:CAMPEP_0196592698 /NCGR_PEP_ID=MMETSP1081-20130531/73522_1 /TAXON_ID=36882 /ORGANISM="Pyramimonas amylifera, Strain CCMP720" /LENGTH=390 /DNA_ID=CAMNT_0041916459 /DNA_START=90 /DNA_END=1262 /DNA_ORIENTATION=+